MLSRKFTTKEKILLLILALVLLVDAYYILVHQRVQRELEEARSRIETATVYYEIETARAAKKAEMQKKIQKVKADGSIRPLPDFDNSTNVVAYLNGVMAATGEYHLVFNTASYSDYVAMRAINMSFDCAGYSAVKDIVTQLERGPYYCEVTALSMSTERESNDMTIDGVAVQLTVVFFEYVGTREMESHEQNS